MTYDFVLPTYWYVDPAGSDTNEGTLASPFLTVQHAVDVAVSGDTVHVAAGPWPGTTTVTTNGVTIDLNGATFTGGSSALIISADDVSVVGPGVFDGGGDEFPAIVVNAGADNFILDGVEIKGWSDGVQVAGAVEFAQDRQQLDPQQLGRRAASGRRADRRGDHRRQPV